ncbi:MAG: hypothetical protein A3J65_01195 [Candidatus Buchananbacteria bacterium RIFCSPHIGHO2_02_FULL_45_11b]|uniref:PDZ domain-containing protein n=3 Tax=Candidatus Buchananiibacteriota TaxID=1817903 RepID=A0A1G1YPU3_9BACT|nr:MAG: hypothetical protein A3J65_01195 [Candidatus Buchananbacteria bacterium RIFCSPHIGHO2_02_FULL_45_11b]OGY53826.1 MAG: hypothetical protein A3B15_00855 [Candidatus Buchananbacteria bacterium RIFCSPLOWO2_01_FULL_45_31]OGY58044.1 MAG: hypothetical protein A3H67_01075 [Candidatus Buchananbacteria bacterium RIFCSPLOWO2_02_FULL_46_11b]
MKLKLSKLFKKGDKPFISQVVILSAAFGFGAGLAGQILANAYLDPWKEIYVSQSLTADIQKIPELKRVKRFLGIEQDFEVSSAVSKTFPALAGIYYKKPAGGNVLNQIYSGQDLLNSGFVLTNDGWLLAFGKNLTDAKKDQLVAVVKNKVYPVENIIVDKATNVVFLKIAANNLAVITLGDSDESVSGQLHIALNGLGETMVSTIKSNVSLSAGNQTMSSERYNKQILLADNLSPDYSGGPLINLAGELIGLVKESFGSQALAAAVPVNQFRPAIQGVLKNNKPSRPFAGINYYDLSLTVGLEQSLSQGQDKGALIYQNPKAKTPAALADLKANDIIVSLDDEPLDKNSGLVDLIQQYSPGEEITLEILREGKTVKQKLTLSASAE